MCIATTTASLDALTVAKAADAKLIVVLSGDNDDIVDTLQYFKRHANLEGVDLAGVIVNKVKDVDDLILKGMKDVSGYHISVADPNRF